MTTFLENLEMSGNLTAVTEKSGNWPKVTELSGKRSYQGKLFIVNIMFGAKPVFLNIVLVQYFWWYKCHIKCCAGRFQGTRADGVSRRQTVRAWSTKTCKRWILSARKQSVSSWQARMVSKYVS